MSPVAVEEIIPWIAGALVTMTVAFVQFMRSSLKHRTTLSQLKIDEIIHKDNEIAALRKESVSLFKDLQEQFEAFSSRHRAMRVEADLAQADMIEALEREKALLARLSELESDLKDTRNKYHALAMQVSKIKEDGV